MRSGVGWALSWIGGVSRMLPERLAEIRWFEELTLIPCVCTLGPLNAISVIGVLEMPPPCLHHHSNHALKEQEAA